MEDYVKASNIAELRAQVRQCIDTGEQITLLNEFAFHQARNRPLEGLEALEEARELAREIGDRDKYADCLITAAICLETLTRHGEALVYLTEAEEEYRQSNNLNGLARCGNTTGLNHRSCSRYPEAIEKFTQVIDMTRGTPYRHHFAAACNNLGATYFILSHYHKALEAFLEALRIYEEDGNVRNKTTLAENIGNVYFHLEDYERSFQYISQALETVRELNDSYGLAHALLNLSALYKVRGEIGSARNALQHALDTFIDIGERKYEGITRVKLASLYEYEGEKEDTLSEFQLGAQMLREAQALNDYADTLTCIARLHLNHNDGESALALLKAELPLIEGTGGELVQCNAYELLAEAYERTGNLTESLACHKRSTELKVKMMGEERQRFIAEMQARYDVNNAEREREIYRIRAEETEKLAEERSKQLSVMAVQLVQKNNLLKTIDENLTHLTDQLGSDLGTIEGNGKLIDTGASAEKTVGLVKSLIRENLCSEEDWKRFEEVYNLVHNDFIQRLAEHAPDLSQMELKVCALLHINLSNKEIADLLYISVRTVESHRYRIRKKLGLSRTDNLATTIFPTDTPS